MSLDDFKDGNTLLLYVLDGEIRINDTTVNTFDLVQFTESGNEIEFEFLANTQVLVLSGEPLNEPVVFGGPFVMNTQEEIEQAQIDFKNGLFGSIEYEKVTTYFLYHWFCT